MRLHISLCFFSQEKYKKEVFFSQNVFMDMALDISELKITETQVNVC